MLSQYSEEDCENILYTIENIAKTIDQLIDWNSRVESVDDYTSTLSGTQLMAANCTLLTAIGEGINRCNRIMPTFLTDNFPDIPWRAIIGMRNHIAHGYFELDADLIFEAIKCDIPQLQTTINSAAELLRKSLS